MTTTVYIAITRGKQRAVITGELDLLRQIFTEVADPITPSVPEPCNVLSSDNPITPHLQSKKGKYK